MIRKLVLALAIVFISSFSANAGSDGELVLKKNEPSEIKDCFETLNRATFTFNQALDGVLFKPVASAYRVLPSPVKAGVSNSLDNISNLVTIPNNILQGDFKKAGVNSGRFILNTTIGILGFIDVAQHLGFPEYEKEIQSVAWIPLEYLGNILPRDNCNTTLKPLIDNQYIMNKLLHNNTK